jgi:hypothetical protein
MEIVEVTVPLPNGFRIGSLFFSCGTLASPGFLPNYPGGLVTIMESEGPCRNRATISQSDATSNADPFVSPAWRRATRARSLERAKDPATKRAAPKKKNHTNEANSPLRGQSRSESELSSKLKNVTAHGTGHRSPECRDVTGKQICR